MLSIDFYKNPEEQAIGDEESNSDDDQSNETNSDDDDEDTDQSSDDETPDTPELNQGEETGSKEAQEPSGAAFDLKMGRKERRCHEALSLLDDTSNTQVRTVMDWMHWVYKFPWPMTNR